MGTSTSVAQLSAKFEALAKSLGNPRPALNAAGMAGKAIFLAEAASAGVLGSKIAGKRKAIGARYDIGGGRRSQLSNSSVVIRYTGPAHLVNNPTAPHVILPRRARGSRRRRGARALKIEGSLRSRASHPGTAGKGFHRKARDKAERELPKIINRVMVREALQKTFG